MSQAHRPLRVTSPLMHGQDIKDAQVDLNWWANRFKLDKTGTDGEWGPDSRRLYRQVFFLLGATSKNYMDAFTVHEQGIVVHHTSPELPPELSRSARLRSAARRRAHTAKLKKQAAASKGAAGVVKEARRWIGTKEQPAGSNRGPHISDWQRAAGMGPGPWCGAFAIHCARTAGFVVPNGWVYVPSIVADASNGRYGRIVPAGQRRAGDLICFDWDGGVFDHVGIVADSASGTVEGNTSFDSGGSQSNGGAVAERHNHAAAARRVVYVRLTKRS